MATKIDDFSEKLESVLNKLRYDQFETTDGRHMTQEGIGESIAEATEKILKESEELAESYRRAYKTEAQIDAILYERLGILIDQKKSEEEIKHELEIYEDNLRAQNKTEKEILQIQEDFKKQRLEQVTDDITKGARSDAWAAVSDGKSRRFEEKSQSFSRFGNALTNLSGGKGIIGKFGGAISKAGGLLTRFAGPIGAAIQAIQLLTDAFATAIKGLTESGKAINKEQELQFNRDKRIKELETNLVIENASTETDIRLAEIERDSAYELELAKIRNQKLTTAQETQIGAITDGINASAWNSAFKSVDISASKQKLENDQLLRNLKASQTIGLRQTENVAFQKTIMSDLNKNVVDYKNASEENAKNWVQFQNDNPWTAVMTGENTNTGLLPSETLLSNINNVDDLINGNNNAVNGNGTWLKRKTDLVGESKNTITGKNYTRGVNFNEGLMGTLYGNAGAIEKTVGNFFGLNDVVKNVQDQQLYTRQWERTAMAESYAARTKMENDLNVTQTKHVNSLYEAQASAINEVKNLNIDMISEVKKNWMKLAQSAEGWADKYDKMIRETAIGSGIRGDEKSMRQYEHFFMNVSSDLLRRHNIQSEEIAALQNRYTEETGRNNILNEGDISSGLILGKYIGDYGASSAIASNMELFNHGVSDSSEMVAEMVSQVEKIGLNGKKYAKDLVKNLKLANKYQFRGGVKGMMEMAKWAQNTRFNMDNLSSMLDKIREGGLENLITTGAGMQVLGGNFAMGADPLAMAWEIYNDPAAFAKRQASMMKGIGKFNSKTGEVEFNQADQIRLQQFAKLTGQNYEDLANQRRQAVRGDRVSKNLTGNNWTDEQKALVTNKAHWDDKSKSWKVNLLKDGTVQETDVSSLTANDLKFLNPENHNEKMENFMERLLSMVDRLTGEASAEQTDIANATLENTLEEYEKRLNIAKNKFADSQEEFINNIITESQKTTAQFKGFMESIVDEETTQSVAQANERAVAEAVAVADTIKQIGRIFDEGRQNLETMIFKTEEEREKSEQEHAQTNEDNRSTGRVAGDLGKSLLNGDILDIVKNGAELTKRLVSDIFGDGVTQGEGNPMTVSASKVTPIHDGAVAKSDPKDHAIFAKMGGPFDKLFNGVFGKIDDVHNILSDNIPLLMSRGIGKFNPKTGEVDLSIGDQMRLRQLSKMSPKPYDPFKGLQVNDTQLMNGQIGKEGGSLSINPIKIEMSGSLELTSNNHSIDIMKELQNNPTLLREITRLISDNISKTLNGGRHVYNGGDLVVFR